MGAHLVSNGPLHSLPYEGHRVVVMPCMMLSCDVVVLFFHVPVILLIRYAGYGSFFLGVFLIYQTKPLEALDIKYWARPRAQAELDVELKMLDKLNARPDLQARLNAVGKSLNLIEDEAYDLVFMKNEYK